MFGGVTFDCYAPVVRLLLAAALAAAASAAAALLLEPDQARVLPLWLNRDLPSELLGSTHRLSPLFGTDVCIL
jgi:hypothetical protein